MTLSDIPTPALIVDTAAMDRNIRRMAEFFAGRRCKLRPHFKAHKTPEIARRQICRGFVHGPDMCDRGRSRSGRLDCPGHPDRK